MTSGISGTKHRPRIAHRGLAVGARLLKKPRFAHRVRRASALAVCVAGVLLANSPACAQRQWQPAKTWLFAVGVLQWHDSADWPAMKGAQKNRRDVQIVEYFKSQGVPETQIAYLRDHEASLARITSAFHHLLAKAESDDLLVFYYTGHGFRDHKKKQVHFANYDATDGATAWSVASIVDAIEQKFAGQRALLMADCCFSGGLADEALRRGSRVAYGCLCSSFSHNSSTGNWTFSDVLLKGLRGDPALDADGDHAIEWDELGRAAELDMAFIERQKAVFVATEAFDKRLKLAAANGPRGDRVGERLLVKWNNAWYRGQIMESRGRQFKVHYVGYANSWDEWVGPERTKPFKPAAFQPGTKVSVKSENKWYPATVRRAWYGLHLVHYDNYSAEWNEWVGPAAIKKR